jgi:hypothetical protein
MFWIIQWLPDSMLYALTNTVLVTGLVLTVVASLVKFVPFINIYRLALQLAGVLLLATGLYFRGGYDTEMTWRQRVADLEEKIRVAENKAPEVTKEIVTKYKDKIVVVNRGVEVVKKEIEIQREVINEGCKLNPTAVELYNRGITGPQETSK